MLKYLKIYILLGVFLLPLLVSGQFRMRNSYKHEFHFSTGASNFLGELGGRDQIGSNFIYDLEVSLTRPTLGIGHKYRFNDMYGIKTAVYYGRVNGDDKLTNETFRKNRNLHFRSPIVELSTQFELFFIQEKISSGYRLRGVKGSKSNNLSAYIFGGIGGFYFNPKAQYQGDWHALQPLGTEGQGIKPGTKKYSRISLNIPFGIGTNYKINNQWSIGIEYGARKTFTDYIDDVSTEYYDNDAIRQENGDLAAYFADPSLGIIRPAEDKFNPTNPGYQRGDPDDKDWYMFALISLHYRILPSRYNQPKF